MATKTFTVNVELHTELVPGGGWSGATSTPGAVGDSEAAGYAENAIARADFVPYQTFAASFQIGIVGFHIDNIDYVKMAVDGGAWKTVSTTSTNTTTGTTGCYNFDIDPSLLSDGAHEARVIVYPVNGVPRVISGLYFSTNYGGTLPNTAKYVATDGNDTTGDGTTGTPYATIMKAANAIEAAQGTGADGGIVYLKAGSHVLGTYSFGLLTTTTNRWLVIMPAPGLTKADVTITGSADSDGLRTKLVKLHDVTITGGILSHAGTSGSVWFSECKFVGAGRTVDSSWLGAWAASYYTDCEVSDSRDAILGAVVARNCSVHDIGSDAYSGCALVANCTVSNINAAGTDFHPDVFQMYPAGDNQIVYGLTATTGIGAQGVFAGAAIPVLDCAFVNVTIDNTPEIQYVFQFGGPNRHVYHKSCSYSGSLGAIWAEGFSATNVVLESTTFSGGPGSAAGVTVR